jgi:dUTP pyrophosphatase
MGFLNINIKKLVPEATIPRYAKPGDAGMDMTAVKINTTPDFIEFETGISMEIPKGFVGLLFPRSSNSKKDLLLCNSVGVIDSGYRGPINFRFKRVDQPSIFGSLNLDPKLYSVGDAVGQIIIMPYPEVKFEEVSELSDSERGSDGFGSTGA